MEIIVFIKFMCVLLKVEINIFLSLLEIFVNGICLCLFCLEKS